jgi:riboflavin synthase
METDLIGKYVERMVQPWTGGSEAAAPGTGITVEYLRKNGF